MTPRRSLKSRLLRGLLALLVLVAVLLVCVGFAARFALAPQAGEWSTPLRFGPLRFEASVLTLVKLATTPWAGPWLDGRNLNTRAGTVHLSWLAERQTLAARCAPCSLHAAALGSEPPVLDELQLTVRRQGEQLMGTVTSGKVNATWQGRLAASGLRAQLQLPTTPIADGYALFRRAIPELASGEAVRMAGSFSLAATLQLPGGDLNVTPQINGFEVSGLGTENFANLRSACSATAANLPPDSWLARAVIAAEDQRFFEHHGFDLKEISAALSHNQAKESTGQRGGSTLPQQLAKLLVTGGERSPVRKLRELLYAVEMEQTLGKARMLQLYLSHAPWGPNLCGAESASRRYFQRAARTLSPAQAAWLAAMLHNPGMELAGWAQSGQVNLARTEWVLRGIRPMPRRQLAQGLEELQKARWPAPDMAR